MNVRKCCTFQRKRASSLRDAKINISSLVSVPCSRSATSENKKKKPAKERKKVRKSRKTHALSVLYTNIQEKENIALHLLLLIHIEMKERVLILSCTN